MIEFKNVSFKYAGGKRQCLKNINLKIKEGESVLICGDSGCGKTSLTRLINGIIPHYYEGDFGGQCLIDNIATNEMTLEKISYKVGSVFQNPKSQFFTTDTTSELVFGCENMGFSEEEIFLRLEKTAKELEIKKLMARNIFELSGGEKQLVACGSISCSNQNIVVLDEPSSNLDFQATKRLEKVIKTWKAQGKTIIIAEHRLYYLKNLIDRVIYMKDGQIKKEMSGEDFFELSDNEALNKGLRILNLKSLENIKIKKKSFKDDKSVKIRNFKWFYKNKKGIDIDNLTLPSKGVVALIGENGAGKSTFSQIMAGMIKVGTVEMGNKVLKAGDRIKSSFLVMQDVNRQLFTESVLDELFLSMEKEDEKLAQDILLEFDLVKERDSHPLALSGGQKQRVAVADAKASARKIIIFDEPSSGLDYSHMKQVAGMMQAMAKEGKLVIVVTHDPELILSACDYVVEIHEGRVKTKYVLDERNKDNLIEFFKNDYVRKERSKMNVKKEKNKKNTWMTLTAYGGKWQWMIYLSLILSATSTVLGIIPYINIFEILRQLVSKLPDMEKIVNQAYMVVLFMVLSAFTYFLAITFSHLFAFHIETGIRTSMMKKLLKLPLGFFCNNSSGKLRKIIDDNASLTHDLMAHHTPDISGAAVFPIAMLIILFKFDFRFGLVSIIALLMNIVFMIPMFAGNNKEYVKKNLEAQEEMSSAAVEYVRGIPVVKIFQQTVYSFRAFKESVDNYAKFAMGYTKMARKWMVLIMISTNFVGIFMTITGIVLINKAFEVEKIVPLVLFYVLFTTLCLSYFTRLVQAGKNFATASEVVKKLEFIENAKSQTFGKLSKVEDCSIHMENITFRYDSLSEKVLDNFSIDIPAGTTLALVGESGSGKSSIACLIPRFYDPEEGIVKIGNVNVKDYSREALMNAVSFVFQNHHLFKESILENLKEGKPDATNEEIMEALKKASCEDLIRKLPDGLGTKIGSQGVYLSGGEEQRLLLARAFLKEAPILVLDEATAFTDPENEHLIQEAFRQLRKGKTTLMIAHRLTSIIDADKIAVIKKGKVAEIGSHEELLKKNGIYKKMWDEYKSTAKWKVKRKENMAC
ncbi:energy-coupling factor transport system ATP-binding protein [Acetitomaculum ruminis DSM 5522]|uniref:Energy-coupling factor transport system ATP-binding protein n=1 Tax=Acetitomaculum ruminis DSM 5522 TaxID=1120918 RepID=A0A1I1AAR8_9FIRM|nr:energy-coupling factor transporter ATPase [Acetitomaculum ruminis]SFB34632.1 energy-coupling factor transport system ATP-binding protein [Acetitomaculum ruminis DSM 5522]